MNNKFIKELSRHLVRLLPFLFFIGGLSIYHFYFAAPKLVAFDVKQTINLYLDALEKEDLSVDQQSAKLASFDTMMRNEVNIYAHENNVMVVLPVAVVSEIEDVTAVIQKRIAARIKR